MADLSVRSAGRLYFDRMHDTWRCASETAGHSVARYGLAGQAIEVRFAGTGLVDLVNGAFVHRGADVRGEPVAMVAVFDSVSTGIVIPPLPWDVGPVGDVHRLQDPQVGIVVHPETPAIGLYDRAAGEGIFWVHSADRLPGWQRAAPLRAHLHWALRSRGAALVHAAAVGDASGVALLIGAGGSGKSTSALACLLDGMTFLGDDYVALTSDPDLAWSVYGSAKVDRPSLDALGDSRLAPLVPADAGKWVLDVRSLMAGQPDGAPIRAIVLPSLAGGTMGIERATPGQALAALGPSTVYQSPDRDGSLLTALAGLVRRVPSFVMRVGGAPQRVPDMVRTVLREAGGG
jgi:hypothetical protein